MKTNLTFWFGIFILFISSALAQSINIILNPSPQAFPTTCQSYSLAFTMAFARVPGFDAPDAMALRASELKIRTVIERIATESKRSAYDHSVWQDAVSELSNKKYVLVRDEFADIEDFMKFIGQMTKVTNAQSLGSVISFLSLGTPIMTSFSQIGTNKYASGHIVTILGVSGNENQMRQLLLLNSAVKIGSKERLLCSNDTFPGDLKYSGIASLESDYTLKTYPSRYIALHISKK